MKTSKIFRLCLLAIAGVLALANAYVVAGVIAAGVVVSFVVTD